MILELKIKCNHINGIQFEALEKELWEHKALDVSKIPLYGNSGFLVSVLMKPEEEENILSLFRKYDTASIIEKYTFERTTLSRKKEYVKNNNTVLSIKISTGNNTEKMEQAYTSKWEYEELAEYARKNQLSLREAREYWNKVYHSQSLEHTEKK